MRQKWLLAAALAWLLAAMLPLPAGSGDAQADEIRPFVVELRQRMSEEWVIDWKQPLSRGSSGPIVPAVPDNCRYLAEPGLRSAPAALLGHGELRCSGDISGGRIGIEGLIGNDDALVRVIPLERPAQSHRLTAAKPYAIVAARPGRWQVLRTYLAIGVDHILTGWDHLLFVIALVLLVRGGWSVVKAATAFTLAHSLTLVASTLGYAGMPQRPVEALIALSIVFLAVELLGEGESWTRRWPWLVAFGFGLVHGFGFAGALREIGLPEGEVPMALFAFNLGVELGQLLVIFAVLAMLRLLERFGPRVQAGALRAASYGIGTISAYWLVDRLAG